MAENVPNPPGGPIPPRPAEPPKAAGKKETVRISLPPKPTATIKLPTLPGGAVGAPPSGAPPAAHAHAPSAAPPPARPAPLAPSAGAPGARVAGPPKSAGAAPPSAPPRSAAPAARRVSGLDFGLAIAAAVIGLGAVVSLFLLLQLK